MVQIKAVAALCSAFVGMSRGAALGTAEEYADGSVHARIMGMKMVCFELHLRIPVTDMFRHNGTLSSHPARWTARDIPN